MAHLIYDHSDLKQAYEAIFGTMPDLSDTERFPERGRPIPDAPDDPMHKNWASMADEDKRAVNRILANIAKAIGAFERKIVSTDAPFDTFMEGLREGNAEKVNALSDDQKRGLQLFVGVAACNQCHSGRLFSDRSFHNIGLPDREWIDPGDLGRYAGIPIVKNDIFNAAGPFSDAPDSKAAREIEFLDRDAAHNRGAFKTPSLRNVEQTAPYMHGGHFESLDEVVDFYANLEPTVDIGHREESLQPFGVLVDEQQKDDLVAFMKSLTGEPVPRELKSQPESALP